MNHPNWKTAPERATHYQPPRDDSGMYNHVYWRLDEQRVPVEAWSVQGDDFCHHPHPIHTSDLFDGRLVPRPADPEPVTWDGHGLPPVGIECEFWPKNSSAWEHCSVLAEHDGGRVVAVHCHDLTYSYAIGHRDQFRPIRTPEQIAAEERKQAISAMAKDIGSVRADVPAYVIADALYDAGYRKQPAP